MRTLIATMKSAGRWLLDFCYPPCCPACGDVTTAEGNLCARCMPGLRHIATPYCACCGAPFAVPMEMDLCAMCLHARPPYAAARAVWVYNDVSRAMIGALKYADRSTEIARYGALLAHTAHTLCEGVDMIVPIPLHWRRLIERRYNQSAWLAYALSDTLLLPVDVRSLVRVRHTKPQARLSLEARKKNMRDAFAVAMPERVRDKIVLLVDDVVTTGATVYEATHTLLEAGVREVRVLSLAKTLRE